MKRASSLLLLLLSACSSYALPALPPPGSKPVLVPAAFFVVVNRAPDDVSPRSEQWRDAADLVNDLRDAGISAVVVQESAQVPAFALAIESYAPANPECKPLEDTGIPLSAATTFTLGLYPSFYCIQLGHAFDVRRGERVAHVDTRAPIRAALGWLLPVLYRTDDRVSAISRAELHAAQLHRLRDALAAVLATELAL